MSVLDEAKYALMRAEREGVAKVTISTALLREIVRAMHDSESAILHAIETSERLHPTAECCVEWQQEIEALRAAVQGPGPVVARLRRASDWPEISMPVIAEPNRAIGEALDRIDQAVEGGAA